MNSLEEIVSDSNLIRKDWLPLEQAIQQVVKFEREFGEAHLVFACHTALPSILTPELVNLIRINFLEKAVEWVAESDLLLSSLCYPIGQDLFEVEPRVREVLLVELKTNPAYGLKRLEELAMFLQNYAEAQLANKLPPYIRRTYRWIADAYLAPDEMISSMFDFLNDIRQEERAAKLATQIQVAKTLELVAGPLEQTSLQVELEDLVNSTRILAYYLYGNREALARILRSNLRNPDKVTDVLSNSIVNWLLNSEGLVDIGQISSRNKQEYLKTLLSDQGGFLRDRLSSFVGRVQELADIRQCIAEKLPTGGYVIITGQAGQGKSSIIAKLIDEYGKENIAFHFIPLNPGPDHQVSLLRNLMARLILKYDLSDLYMASESRPALRDYFPKALDALVAKGGQEVIFIDGLDQLEEELSGTRDLSFLPNNPPPGIVFVLGTRPNDTLKPLELLKPRHEYQLPNLSRSDFDLILQHRQVTLEPGLADRFYHAMQENALYLDLVAKELAQSGHLSPSVLIQQIVDNPENLFSLATDRFKRHPVLWREVIKPVLGVLLVAQEPLSRRQLRQIIAIDADSLKDGLERLGGFVIEDGQQRYSLYHLKFRDYLREDSSRPQKEYIFAQEEVEQWHWKLAVWCEQHNLACIWEDELHNKAEQERREYARHHYITHLFHARQWHHLFAVLDTGQYGRAKVQDDPSMRSYAQDLELGQRAAVWEGWTLEEGIGYLPHLWRYTLLRSSMASRADKYPREAFRLLVLLRRKQEALGLAELLTKPIDKVRAFLQIAGQIREQSYQEKEALELLLRAGEIVHTIEEKDERAWGLRELGAALAQAQQWEQAERVIGTIADSDERARALRELGAALAQVQQWKQAEHVISMIADSDERARALRELGAALAQAQQWEQARRIWAQAERVIGTIADSDERAEALRELGIALVQAQQWQQAQSVISTIRDPLERAKVLVQLASALAQAQQWIEVQVVWTEVEAIAHTIENSQARAEVLSVLGGQLARAQQWERAEAVWTEVEAIARTIEDSQARAEVLSVLGEELARAQQWERAEAVWTEVVAMAGTIENSQARAKTWRTLSTKQTQIQRWEQSEVLLRDIQKKEERARALEEEAKDLEEAGRFEQLLRLVQHSWLQADTRDYALMLLILAKGLIPFRPEIETAFFEATSWVEAFLR